MLMSYGEEEKKEKKERRGGRWHATLIHGIGRVMNRCTALVYPGIRWFGHMLVCGLLVVTLLSHLLSLVWVDGFKRETKRSTHGHTVPHRTAPHVEEHASWQHHTRTFIR